ncbi:hypothetical protein [Gemmatimonas groenlandica]|uniref:Uncharacterized protein n=1 Tax=Gemmatimonas groenlandica TaxID=2732249 RepID=A0A6M4IXF3_9BACT|nr:hypothetical protein [Gemmatimonas groenlandica]QJR36851.1 hypothetical protein HKW67_15665 [Gemmatimonas groenlandica]
MTYPRLSMRSSFRDSLRAPLRSARAIAGAVGLLAAVACDSRPSSSNPDSASAAGGPGNADSVSTTVSSSGWDSGAGPFVVLPTVDGGLMAGSLLRPDASELTVGDTAGVGAASADGRLELFARSGKVGVARLTVEGAPRVDEGCTAWPVARLAVDAGVTVAPWTAAFAVGRVTAIPLDSIEGLASRDSARLATDLTRLASGLADDTSSTFRGLPFVVMRAWRTRGLDTAFIVATLARRVNQEDDPKEERLVVVVDAIGDNAKAWTVAWHERAAGHEEELVVAEPLLAFRNVGAPDVRLLFGRDDGVALGAAVLTRGRSGWRVLWESAVAGCN